MWQKASYFNNGITLGYTAKDRCSVPGMPTLKLVNVTFLLVVHLKRCLSAVLERPVQKYFSGLKPTELTKKAFSYLHSKHMYKPKDEQMNDLELNPLLCHLTYQPHPLDKRRLLSRPGSPLQMFFSPILCCSNKSGTWSSPGQGGGKSDFIKNKIWMLKWKLPHARVCSLDWFPLESLGLVWWMPSSYTGIRTSSHTCGRPTSPPVSTTPFIIVALTGRHWNPFLLASCECYLSSDEDTVLLEVVGMRWFVALPVGEANWGAIRPLKQHLVPLIIQADPEHICRHWRWKGPCLEVCFIYLNHSHIPACTHAHLQYPDWENMKLCSSMLWMLARSPPSLWHADRASVHITLFLSR